MSLDRFASHIDAHDGVLFTGTSDDPIDPAKDNYEPGLYLFVEGVQTDDMLDRD